jgi:hypothetical protein
LFHGKQKMRGCWLPNFKSNIMRNRDRLGAGTPKVWSTIAWGKEAKRTPPQVSARYGTALKGQE